MIDKMILVEDKSKCCGCGACMQICPRNAISMEEDQYGFVYPKIDESKCVKCGACRNICSFQNPKDVKKSLKAYAFSLKDDKKIMASASGGAFYALAEKMINQGGIVYGAVMEKINDTMVIRHKRAEGLEDLQQFQGSKYVQSDMTEAFSLIRNDLLQGRQVLFSGTPCQNAALKKFLAKEYNNLHTVEIICHGVPNARLFRDFLKFYEDKLKGSIDEFYFRDKSRGQGYITKTLYTAKDNSRKIKIKPGEQFAYIRFFSKSLTLRENCYHCPYAGENRVADITIGDFWGFNDVHPEMTGNGHFTTKTGISCVLVNTERGLEYLSKCDDSFYLSESSFEKVQKHNEQLKAPTTQPARRQEVLDTYALKGYAGLEEYYSRKFLKDRVKYRVAEYLPRDLKSCIRKMISK